LKSFIAHCKTEKFLRVRVGVGKLPENGDMIKHVLGKLPKAERAEEENAFSDAASAIEFLVKGDIDGAMNRFN
jgi:PTH1 family peptidyl-tRNA hydrolase